MQTCHSKVSSLAWSFYPLQLCLLQVIAEVTSSLSQLSQLLNVVKEVLLKKIHPSESKAILWFSVSLREWRRLPQVPEREATASPG